MADNRTNVLRLRVEYDTCTDDPLADDEFVTLDLFEDRHSRGIDRESILDDYGNVKLSLRQKLRFGTAFVVSKYEHGGVSYWIYGQGGCHQNDMWDTTSEAGILYLNLSRRDRRSRHYKTYESRLAAAKSVMETYTAWCNGDTYSCDLTTDDEESIDGCGGLIGHDYAKEEITASIRYYMSSHPELTKIDFVKESDWLEETDDLSPDEYEPMDPETLYVIVSGDAGWVML